MGGRSYITAVERRTSHFGLLNDTGSSGILDRKRVGVTEIEDWEGRGRVFLGQYLRSRVYTLLWFEKNEVGETWTKKETDFWRRETRWVSEVQSQVYRDEDFPKRVQNYPSTVEGVCNHRGWWDVNTGTWQGRIWLRSEWAHWIKTVTV